MKIFRSIIAWLASWMPVASLDAPLPPRPPERPPLDADALEALCATFAPDTPVRLETVTTPALRRGCPFKGVRKRSSVAAVANVNYGERVNAELAKAGQPADFTPADRAWGDRLAGGVLAHEGKRYLQVDVQSADAVYFDDAGQPVEAAALRPWLRATGADAAEVRQGLARPVILRTYGFESIRAITVNGTRHPVHAPKPRVRKKLDDYAAHVNANAWPPNAEASADA
jgi:hypothetical protein